MDYGKCTGLINCACPACYDRAVTKLREATDVSRQLREMAIAAIAQKWGLSERTVIHSLRR